jgi:uncharacterized membrane protein
MESPAHQVRQGAETIASLDHASEQSVTRHQHLIERITYHLGRPRTLHSLLVLVAAWIGMNTLLPAWRWDRPPFFWLQGLIALLSLATTTVVLITQNRWIRRMERRSEVELHINLLAEEKIGKFVALLEELRRDMPSVREIMDEIDRSVDQAGRRAR